MRQAWLMWMLGLMLLVAFAAWQYKACDRPLEFTAAAVFTLHPVTGQPLIVSDYYRFYLDWEGNPLLVKVGGLPASGQPRGRANVSWDPEHEVQFSTTTRYFDDDVFCTALQPPVPRGWRRLLAVTVGLGMNKKKVEYIIDGESYSDTEIVWKQYDVYFYDYDTTELLAEIDLNKMYTTLYAPNTGGRLHKAYVSNACLSPSGELAIIIYFKSDSGFLHELGIWRNKTWVPILGNQAALQVEYPLYVGPGGWSIYNVRNGDSGYIAFYDPGGQLSAKYTRSGPSWRRLAMATLEHLGTTAAMTAAASQLAVLLLAFIWHFLVPLMPRRRLESRRADSQ